MADIISCPSCQRKLQVPETLLGQDVQCPSCGATFVAQIGGRPPMASGPRPVAQERWEVNRHADAARPLHGDAPYEEDYGTDYGQRRRGMAPHRGALILTLGILGLVFLIPAPLAWILGNTDINEIQAGHMDPEGEGMTQAGRVCGIIGTVFLAFSGCCCGFSMLSSTHGMR